MIKLDDAHWIQSVSDVRAIRPSFIRDGIDPDRCAILISRDWLIIEKSVDAVVAILNENNG